MVTNDNPLKSRIVILPGHWQKDSGAVDPPDEEEHDEINTFEVDLALWYSEQLRYVLESCGASVRMMGGSLKSRAAAANFYRPALTLSVHFNAGPAAASGVETWWTSKAKHPQASKRLSQTVQSYVVHALGQKDRGIKDRSAEQKRIYVLETVDSPIALLEVGFITNPAEERAVSTLEFRMRWALAVTGACAEFLST